MHLVLATLAQYPTLRAKVTYGMKLAWNRDADLGADFRHGDIEDTLLGLLTSYAYGKGAKFTKLDVKRVYFGNWLRDYSQAVDVGTVKHVSADAIRILLWVLGFLSFGYGTGEFEVTSERLGCYRPEEHIDNPKDYADNEDARQYDRRLRGPINEEVELAVDEETGLKNYIANERARITTSAGLVRDLFGRAIQLGRQFSRNGNKADFYEALRLLGTGCHCLEDYSAHSNFTELALIELGEQQVFPHVGRRTQVRLPGARHPVYPIVTGTFGGVDFFHSVMGEMDDKTTQSEISELEGVMTDSQNQDTSMLQNLLSSLPSGLFGGKDQAGRVDELQQNANSAQMQNMNISPRQPEAWTKQINEVSKQIYPILEFHDDIMKGITETIDKMPILPDLIEQIQEQVNVFVFSLLAPFVLPIIRQVQTELATGSSEVIQSSRDKQLIVFHDDESSDPTHSMLSKDHFSNILNEPAGQIGCAVLKWVVPQIVSCWDDERVDVDRTLNRIINGVFNHPALRAQGDDGASDGRMIMFGVVEQWWSSKSDYEKDDLRQKLSREGVESGQNHKEGVQDTGHGCCKPLGFAKPARNNAPAAAAHAAVMQGLNQALTGEQNQGGNGGRPGSGAGQQASSFIGEAVGGGVFGNVVGGLVGGVGASILGGAFASASGGDGGGNVQTFQSSNYNDDGSHSQSTMQTGRLPGSSGHGNHGGQSAQAEYTTTEYPGGGYKQEYDRFEQSGSSSYGYEQTTETRPTSGGGYEQRSEQRFDRPDGRWESEVQQQSVGAGGKFHQSEQHHHGRRQGGSDVEDDDDDDEDDNDDYEKKERKRREKERKKREKEERKRHSGGSDDGNDGGSPRRGHGKHGSRDEGRHEGRTQESSGGYPGANYGGESFDDRRDRYEEKASHGRQEQPEYGRQEQSSYGRQEQSGYGRQEQSGYDDQRPAYGGYEERPPPQRQGFGGGGDGDGYGGGQGGFGGGYEQPPPRNDYGGGYQEPPRRQGYSGGEDEMPGGFPDEEGEPRRHGQHGGRREEESYGGGYGGRGGY